MAQWLGLGRLPNLQRSAAAVMALLQSLALGLLMHRVGYLAAPLVLAGWFAAPFRLLWPIPVGPAAVLLIFATLIQYRLTPLDLGIRTFIGSELAFEIAICCLAVQVLLMFCRQYGQRLPMWYLAVSGAGMVFGGDVRVNPERRELMMWLMGAYFVAWGVFASASRMTIADRPRPRVFRTAVLCVALALSVMLGRYVSVALHRHENQLERLLSELISPSPVARGREGFSAAGGMSDMSNWKQFHSEEITLRVDAPFQPDYLRCRAFDAFANNRWFYTTSINTLSAVEDVPGARRSRPNEYVFQLRPELSDSSLPITVWPLDVQTSAHLFMPLNAVGVACDSNFLRMDRGRSVTRPLDSGSGSYVVLVTPSQLIEETEAIDPKFLQLPPTIDPYVAEMAHRLCGPEPTSAGKIQAVRRFFQDNFTYQLGVRLPRDVDRLAYFLRERPAAHCEYFATATAILLRLSGVPARYVTGFVVSERSSLDGSWVARRKHSHAWVEAYDAERSAWVTVESTPEEGIPAASEPTQWQASLEAGRSAAFRLWDFLQSGALWRWLLTFVKILAMISVLGVLFWLAYPWLGPRSGLSQADDLNDEDLRRLTRERARLDRTLARHGVARFGEETVLRFAERLEQEERLTTGPALAAWYRRYALLRFRGRGLNESDFSSLIEERLRLAQRTENLA
jgi:transglutaminase-like putative cysteine protease